MRSKQFLALLLGGSAVVSLASGGCGSSDNGTSGTTSGAGGHASTTASSTSGTQAGPVTTTVASTTAATTSAVTTVGSGGAGGGSSAGHDFATATPIMVDAMTPLMGTLKDVSTPDFYTFTGHKGDSIVVQALAAGIQQPPSNNAAGNIVDTVVTIWDPNKSQVAQDDDGWPRFSTDSILFTVLPADGTYWVEVQDCNDWAKVQPGVGCAPPANVMIFNYELQLFTSKNLVGNATEGAAAGGESMPPVAQMATYTKPAGQTSYAPVNLNGILETATDIDVFEVVTKADADAGNSGAAGSRPRLDLFIQPSGTLNGNGSTTPPGAVWVSSTLDATVTSPRLASLDVTKFGEGDLIVKANDGPADLTVPITLGSTYYVYVQHAPGAEGANDFYFMSAYAETFYGNQYDKNAHATSATAFKLKQQMNADKSVSYFSDGDIAAPMAEMWYEFDAVPATEKFATGGCTAVRGGAGLTGFSYGLYASDGTTAIGAPIVEGIDKDYTLAKTALPAGSTTVMLKVTATGQDPVNLGTSYRCGVTFSPM